MITKLSFVFVLSLLLHTASTQENPFYFSSYFGSRNSLESGKAVVVDTSRSLVFVGGWTNGTGQFPVTSTALQSNNAAQNDAGFLSVFTLEGTLIYSTYILDIGSTTGISDMYLSGTTLYIGGSAGPLLPTTSNAFQNETQGGDDGFVAAFDTSNPLNLTVIFFTYLGGSSNDFIRGVTAVGSNLVCVSGQTYSSNFPLLNEIQSNISTSSAFVSCFNSSGFLTFSTYLGGSGEDFSTSITSDGFSTVYVGGRTASSDFPLYNPFRNKMEASEGFITAIDLNVKEITFSTFYGGNSDDAIYGVWYQPVDKALHFAGSTMSDDLKLKNPIQKKLQEIQDAMVGCFDSKGKLVYATYLGGNGVDTANAITADLLTGNVAIVGQTSSTNFPLQNELHELTGDYDAFVTVLSFSGFLLFSSYFGSNSTDSYNAAFFSKPSLAVVGSSNGRNFPVTDSPYFSNGSVVVSFFNTTALLGDDLESSSDYTRTAQVGGALVVLVILICCTFIVVAVARKYHLKKQQQQTVQSQTANTTSSTTTSNVNRNFQQLDEDL